MATQRHLRSSYRLDSHHPQLQKVLSEREKFEELAWKNSGVSCSVHITPAELIITTADYPDYLLAKRAISPHTILPIKRGHT
jgi:hypothetical protein